VFHKYSLLPDDEDPTKDKALSENVSHEAFPKGHPAGICIYNIYFTLPNLHLNSRTAYIQSAHIHHMFGLLVYSLQAKRQLKNDCSHQLFLQSGNKWSGAAVNEPEGCTTNSGAGGVVGRICHVALTVLD